MLLIARINRVRKLTYRIGPEKGIFFLILYICNIRAPRSLGILGERLFIFRELGSTVNYFQGLGEQAHSLGD